MVPRMAASRSAASVFLVLLAGLSAQDQPPLHPSAGPDWAKLRAGLESPQAGRRWQALRQCLKLGRDAARPLMQLLKSSEDPAVLQVVGAGLQELGPAATGILEELDLLLRKGSSVQLREALEVARVVGPFAGEEEAMRLLNTVYRLQQYRRGLKTDRALLRTPARVPALVALHEGRVDSPAKLKSALSSGSGLQRLHALQQARFAPSLGAAEAKLVAAQLEQEVAERQHFKIGEQHAGGSWSWSGSIRVPSVPAALRLAAARLLDRHQAWPKTLPRHLRALALLGHPDPMRRRQAVLGLGTPPPEAVDRVVAALTPMLTDPAETVVWEVITVFGMLGARAEKALPSLERLAKGADRNQAIRARAAIQQIKAALEKKQDG